MIKKNYMNILNNPPNGESIEQIYLRSKKELNYLTNLHINDTILIVGHRIFNQALITAIKGKSSKDIRGLERQKNACLNIFNISNKGYNIEKYNCINHLK